MHRAVFTCAGETVFHHSRCINGLSVKREGDLQLTAKLQSPEWDPTFCRRLMLISELLQLEFVQMKSPDIYKSGACNLMLSVSHCDDVSPPAIKSKVVVG